MNRHGAASIGVRAATPGGRNGVARPLLRSRTPELGNASRVLLGVVALIGSGLVVAAGGELGRGELLTAGLFGAGAVLAAALVPLHLRAAHASAAPFHLLLDRIEPLGTTLFAAGSTPASSQPPQEPFSSDRAVDALIERIAADRRRLRETAARGARAQEAERIRIARDLRDDVAQTLSGLLIQLRVVRALPEASDRERVLDEIGAELGGSIERLRRFAQAVHPPSLDELGPVAALSSYARTLSAGTRLQIQVAGPDLRSVLAAESALALYRVAQEALANVARHARAARARVRVERGPDGEVTARIEDDGVGFDLHTVEANSPCLGLFTMRERALAVGGTVTIASHPGGGGTTVAVRIPANHAAHAKSSSWPTILPSDV